MKTLMFCLSALMIAGAASASCCIPPRHVTVVTSCGKVTVYVTTKKGFAAYDGPVAVRYAQYVPFNQRVDSGCKR